jgi:hypothetical protein
MDIELGRVGRLPSDRWREHVIENQSFGQQATAEPPLAPAGIAELCKDLSLTRAEPIFGLRSTPRAEQNFSR